MTDSEPDPPWHQGGAFGGFQFHLALPPASGARVDAALAISAISLRIAD